MVREAEGCQDSTKGPSEEQCLTWAASVGHGCPRPGLLGCWSPRCTASVGSPCSGQQLQVRATPPAACLLGVASWQPHARPHRGQYFLGACVAWRAEVPWPATCSWGWRCRGWCRCRCRWSPPWRGGLALALEGPGGQTSDHHCGCWTRCWRGCYCWSDWSTGALLWNACWGSLCLLRPAWRRACSRCFQPGLRAGPGQAHATEALQEDMRHTSG